MRQKIKLGTEMRYRQAKKTTAGLGGAVAVMAMAALSACSPGGVVAGTIGAAGAVAGTAVDVILRDDSDFGGVE